MSDIPCVVCGGVRCATDDCRTITSSSRFDGDYSIIEYKATNKVIAEIRLYRPSGLPVISAAIARIILNRFNTHIKS